MKCDNIEKLGLSVNMVYYNEVNSDFYKLTKDLDREFYERNSDLQVLYSQYNKLDNIKDILVAYSGSLPIGCCSLRYFSAGVYEIKRVYVSPDYRSNGVATEMMRKLEDVAIKKGIRKLILETGVSLEAAQSMYKKLGFEVVPNYGQYVNMRESLCMSKVLPNP